ncbi:MAG: hypothetical protein JWM25_1644, partial [Thermoleophilia bacterium]|nr:hypothetical protein [Thermoleophilia bacterium]
MDIPLFSARKLFSGIRTALRSELEEALSAAEAKRGIAYDDAGNLVEDVATTTARAQHSSYDPEVPLWRQMDVGGPSPAEAGNVDALLDYMKRMGDPLRDVPPARSAPPPPRASAPPQQPRASAPTAAAATRFSGPELVAKFLPGNIEHGLMSVP